MFCEQCGKHVSEGDAFCKNCGNKLQGLAGSKEDKTVPSTKKTKRWKKLLPVLVILGLLAGYYLRPLISSDLEKKYSFFHSKISELSSGTELACSSVASADISKFLHEDGIVHASINEGTDKLSLKYIPEAKTLRILTAAGVEAGGTEGEPLQIVEDDNLSIVAIGKHGVMGPNYTTLVLNKKNLDVIWTKNADTIGRFGSVMYLTCN